MMDAFGAKPMDSQDADDPASWFSGLDWLKPQATRLQGSSPTAATARGVRPLTSNTGRGAQPNQLLQQATAVSKVHARRPRPAASLPSLGPKPLLQQQRAHAVPVQPASVCDCFPGDESDPDSETQQERTAVTNPKPAASRTVSSSKHTLQHSSFDLDLFGSKAVGTRQQQQQQQQQQPNKSTAAAFSRPARKEAAAAASDGPSWLQPLGMPAARLPDTTAAACGRGGGGGSKQQTNRSSLPVFTLPGRTAADTTTAPTAAAAAGCQIVSAQGELELVLLSPGRSAWGVDADNSLGSLQHQQQEGEGKGQEQTSELGVPAATAAQGKLGSGSRQFRDLSTQQQQQQLAAYKQSKLISEFDYAADSQGDGPEGSQGDGVGADSSGYRVSQSDSLSGADSTSDSDGAAADAAASPSSGSLWSGSSSGSGSGGGSSGHAGSADDSDVSFLAEGSQKRKQTGQAAPGLKRPRQQHPAAAKAAHKAVRFADEDGKGLVAGDLQQQWRQQQQQKAAQRRSSSRSSLKAGSSNAARGRSVLELGAVLPGEVPLLLPSVPNLTRNNILLVELPAGFDTEGDAGAIGRVVCNPAGPTAGAAAADGTAVARVAGRLQERDRRTASNKPVAAAGTAADRSADDAVSSDALSNSSGSAGGSEDGSQGCAGHTDRGAGAGTAAGAVPVLDLKGTIYDLQELLLAGTAAVVRINAPGKGVAAAGKLGPTAHMEHLLGSFVRAVPSAAAAGADQDYSEAFEFGLLDADEDVFGVGADAGGVGGEEGGGGGRGGRRAGGRGRGRGGSGGEGKKPRPRGGRVSGLGALGLGGGARKGKGAGARGRARGGGRGGKRKSAAGRRPAGAKAAGGLARNAAARAAPEGGGKGSSKSKKKKPWETDSDVDASE